MPGRCKAEKSKRKQLRLFFNSLTAPHLPTLKMLTQLFLSIVFFTGRLLPASRSYAGRVAPAGQPSYRRAGSRPSSFNYRAPFGVSSVSLRCPFRSTAGRLPFGCRVCRVRGRLRAPGLRPSFVGACLPSRRRRAAGPAPRLVPPSRFAPRPRARPRLALFCYIPFAIQREKCRYCGLGFSIADSLVVFCLRFAREEMPSALLSLMPRPMPDNKSFFPDSLRSGFRLSSSLRSSPPSVPFVTTGGVPPTCLLLWAPTFGLGKR